MALEEPVTLAEAKKQCRVEFDTDDDLISAYITAAREWAEGFLGFSLMRETADDTPVEPDTETPDTGGSNDDPDPDSGDLSDNSEVPDTTDTNNNENTDGEPQSGDNPEPEPDPEPIEIKQIYRQAILLVVAFWYANRENASVSDLKQIPLGAKDLLWLDRKVPV